MDGKLIALVFLFMSAALFGIYLMRVSESEVREIPRRMKHLERMKSNEQR